MLTDDDILTQLRGTFAGQVADVLPDPALLGQVRHAHHKSVRRQRLLIPAGIGALSLAAAGAYTTWPSAGAQVPDQLAAIPTATTAESPAPEAPGSTVTVFDYTFTLPAGFVVSSNKEVDLSKQQPPQPVHGMTGGFSARRGAQTIDLTVYRGPIADAEASVQPPSPDSLRTRTIAGFPAKTYTYAAGGPQCVTKENGRSLIRVEGKGPCQQEGGETRVTTAPHELVWVNSEDVPMTTVDAILESGLRS